MTRILLRGTQSCLFGIGFTGLVATRDTAEVVAVIGLQELLDTAKAGQGRAA